MTSNGKIQITDIDGSVVICDEWFLDLTWSKFVGEYKDKNGNIRKSSWAIDGYGIGDEVYKQFMEI